MEVRFFSPKSVLKDVAKIWLAMNGTTRTCVTMDIAQMIQGKMIMGAMITVLICIAGCSSLSSREKIDAARESARPKPAAVYMDGFWTDYRSPADKEVQHWEFYYKHCSLVGRKPYPDRAEYMCTEPY